MGTYKVRTRLDCERYDFRLRRRVFDVFEEHSFSTLESCVDFIDATLKSKDIEKYFGYKLKIEILEDYEVLFFVTIHLGWDKETSFLFSSDESVLPLKDEYYHKKQQNSIWGPAPEW